MSQVHAKFLVDSLNDESNLAQSLPTLLASISQVGNATEDPAMSNKLHIRLAALLSSKNVNARWAAVCLAKGLLDREEGCWQTLESHGLKWMQIMLVVLDREENETAIERIVSTLSTIIGMIKGKPALTRELTTQLPTFFSSILNILIKPHISTGLIKNILYQLHGPMTSHSTTFRTFAGRLRAIVMNYINGSSADPELIQLAARTFSSLHLCAPKNTIGDQWTTEFMQVLGECHNTVSFIFRSVKEDVTIRPPAGSLGLLQFTTDYVSQVPLAVRRLQSLMPVIDAFLSLPTKDTVKIPVGQVVMLVERLLMVTRRSNYQASAQKSDQIALISVLPQLHKIAFDILVASYRSLGRHMLRHSATIQHLILIDCQSPSQDCRVAALQALHASISSCGIVSSKRDNLSKTLQDCVAVLRKVVPTQTSSLTNKSSNGMNGHVQKSGQKKRKHPGSNDGSDQIWHESTFFMPPASDLITAATHLLQLTLTNLPGLMTPGTRQQLDSTTLRLLNGHADQLPSTTTIHFLSLLAASLHSSESSPFAASLLSAGIKTIPKFCNSSDSQIREAAMTVTSSLETLIHPRFPAMRSGKTKMTQDEFDVNNHDQASSSSASSDAGGDGGDDDDSYDIEERKGQDTLDMLARVEDTKQVNADDTAENGKDKSTEPTVPSLFQVPPDDDPTSSAASNRTRSVNTLDVADSSITSEERPEISKRQRFTLLDGPAGSSKTMMNGQERLASDDNDDDDDMEDNDENLPDICTDSDTDPED